MAGKRLRLAPGKAKLMRRNQTIIQWCAQLLLLAGIMLLPASSAAAQEVPENPVIWSLTANEPLKKHDENFGMETEFYETAVTFTLPVRVGTNATAGQHKLQVQVRFQTCSDELCLPPKLMKLELAVEVASK